MADDSSSKPPPDLPALPFERVSEFPDQISPMIVKELRQGLRTTTFVIPFLLLQIIPAFVLLITSLSATAEGGADTTMIGRFMTGFIMVIYALGVLVFHAPVVALDGVWRCGHRPGCVAERRREIVGG